MKSSYATDSIFLKRTLIFRRSSRYLLGALYTICIMMYYAFQRRLFSCCQQHGHRQLRLFYNRAQYAVR